MAQPFIVLSQQRDLHAWAVVSRLRARFAMDARLVAIDRLPYHGGFQWAAGPDHIYQCRFYDVEGTVVDLGEAWGVWARRLVPDRVTINDLQRTENALINNEMGAAIRAALLCTAHSHKGSIWISSLAAQQRAESKLLQLRVAAKIGFTIPPTIVSKSPRDIRSFASTHMGQGSHVVVKPMAGVRELPLLCCRVSANDLTDDSWLSASLAVYQKEVPGDTHLRVLVLGDRVFAYTITSPDLDWRRHLYRAKVAPTRVDSTLATNLVGVLSSLELRMGVFDLKLNAQRDDEPVFLEVNPQGQFLFCEAVGGGPDLTEAFCEFVRDLAYVSGDMDSP